jgi:hypothetical protein
MSSRLPLSALLSQVLLSLGLEFERPAAGGDPTPGLEVWSNLLRAVGTAGVVERDLPARLRLSKRAVRARVGNALRRGWLRTEKGKAGTATAVLGLTEQGQRVRTTWPGLALRAVDAWSARVGTAGTLRTSLRTLVAQLELEHAHFPAGYGAVDWSVTGNGGTDWRPIRREPGDTVADLPLPSLLSQALMAITLEYEGDGGCLAFDANVLRFLDGGGRPVTSLPPQGREGLDTLVRHGFVDRTGGVVRLLDRGFGAKEGYEPRLAAIETRWNDAYRLGPLREVLEEIVRRLDLDLPHHPIGVVDPRTGRLVRGQPSAWR